MGTYPPRHSLEEYIQSKNRQGVTLDPKSHKKQIGFGYKITRNKWVEHGGPLSEDMIYTYLFNLGHNNTTDEDKQGARNLERIPIKLSHRYCKDMIRSYQEWFQEDLNDLVISYHDRHTAYADGEAGPAFENLIKNHMLGGRCPHPDFPSGDNILYNREMANWPTSCRMRLKIGKSFKKLPGLSEQDTDDIWWAIANNTTYFHEDMKCRYKKDTSDAKYYDIFANLERLGGSVLAWNMLARNRCDVTLASAYDSDRTWRKSLGVATGTHECFHGWGHNHVNDSSALMFPSINQSAIARNGAPNNTDLRQSRNLGYKVNESARPLDPSDLFNPKLFDHGTDPTDPTDPVDPVDPVDPTDPIDDPIKGAVLELRNGKKYTLIDYIEFAE